MCFFLGICCGQSSTVPTKGAFEVQLPSRCPTNMLACAITTSLKLACAKSQVRMKDRLGKGSHVQQMSFSQPKASRKRTVGGVGCGGRPCCPV